MRLEIRATALGAERLSRAIVGEFDERGGTIGRSDSNTLTLPDPERYVSRLQAEIDCAGGRFSIRNAGGANPIVVNGRLVKPGEVSALQDGDQLVIGGYALQVRVHAEAPAAWAPEAVDPRTVIGASAAEGRTAPPRRPAGGPDLPLPPVPASPPWPAPAAAPSSSASPLLDDPFTGLFPPGAPAASMASAADPFADLLGASAGPRSAPQRTPADPFDPFASPPPAAARRPPGGGMGVTAGDPLAAHAKAPALDTLFGLEPDARQGADPLAAFLSGAPATAGPAPATDPFAFLDRPTEGGPAAPDHASDLDSAYRPPPVRPPPVPRPAPHVAGADATTLPPSRTMPAADGRREADALWDAFFAGAGIAPPDRRQLTPALMEVIGATLRQAVDGAVQLSVVRTTAKQELSVPVTVIQAGNNNPLQFAPDATAALAMLVQPPMRGFMPAPEAMQDVMTDVLGHTVGTMAGTRAALQGMLARFEPAQLEAQLARGGVLDTLVPMTRRARLWELYVQHYGQIFERVRNDFQELFGRAFVQAYEAQADDIAEARRGQTGTTLPPRR